jgi:hypothetical protein
MRSPCGNPLFFQYPLQFPGVNSHAGPGVVAINQGYRYLEDVQNGWSLTGGRMHNFIFRFTSHKLASFVKMRLCRAPRNAVATAPGEGACSGWSCPRATRARSRRYVLRPPCLWHVLQPQTEVHIARSGCRRRGACHMPLPGGGTTRIKRDQII